MSKSSLQQRIEEEINSMKAELIENIKRHMEEEDKRYKEVVRKRKNLRRIQQLGGCLIDYTNYFVQFDKEPPSRHRDRY